MVEKNQIELSIQDGIDKPIPYTPTVTGLAALGDVASMEGKLRASLARIKLVHDFVETNFMEGVHFGTADDRSDKKVLLKAGAEQVCNLFTRPRWRRDDETIEMISGAKDANKTVCFICELIDNATGNIVGEGRGAETVGNRARDINKTIKMAKIHALTDAALTSFGLSGKFTQDIEKTNELIKEKKLFMSTIENARSNIDTKITTVQFIIAATRSILKRSDIPTIGALKKMNAAIFSDHLVDMETGELNDKN